jgi:hypothetical protein
MPKTVLGRVRAFGALAAGELERFIEAKFNGTPTPRLDKPCGHDRLGNIVCQMHLDLALRHYRLTDRADPLLVYQQFDSLLHVFGLTFHEDMFHGNERRWCHEWQHAIIWEDNEHHLRALNDEFGPLID